LIHRSRYYRQGKLLEADQRRRAQGVVPIRSDSVSLAAISFRIYLDIFRVPLHTRRLFKKLISMNKKLFGFLAFIAASLLPCISYAQTWTPILNISGIQTSGYNTDGSRVYIYISPALPTNCTGQGAGSRLRLNASTALGKYQLGLFMMALNTGKAFTVSITQCDDWGVPVIFDAQFNP
jgi:hypothetical protein